MDSPHSLSSLFIEVFLSKDTEAQIVLISLNVCHQRGTWMWVWTGKRGNTVKHLECHWRHKSVALFTIYLVNQNHKAT